MEHGIVNNLKTLAIENHKHKTNTVVNIQARFSQFSVNSINEVSTENVE